MCFVLQWVKEKNPHAIFVIENPVGQMSEMPLMQQLVKTLNLCVVKVDYCAFGRSDMKPTNIWTNVSTVDVAVDARTSTHTLPQNAGLRNKLSRYVCGSETCQYYKKKHPLGVRGQGHLMNFSAIPQQLAKEVATWVDSHFYGNDLRYTKEIIPTQAEIDEFNSRMAS